MGTAPRAGPSTVTAIAVDVAARAFTPRDVSDATVPTTETTAETTAETMAGVETRAMSQSRTRMMTALGRRRGGDADEDGVMVDADALFSDAATEGSLRGGSASSAFDDGGLETIKFESALASAEAYAAPGEEDGRRPPTPGKARAWLVNEGNSGRERDVSPTRGEETSMRTRTRAVLTSPKRNGSMQFLSADDDETRLRLVATPTLVPRVRSLDAGSLGGSPTGSISERSMETDGGEHEIGAHRVSSSLCASSTLSNASAFSPMASRSVSRNASMGDVSKTKHF